MKSVPLIQKANATPNAIFAPVPVDLEGVGGSSDLEVGTQVPLKSTQSGSSGVSSSASREDHQHPDPTMDRVVGLLDVLGDKADLLDLRDVESALEALEARVTTLESA